MEAQTKADRHAPARDATFSVCLAYPNTREVAAGYLGFHKIFSAFDACCRCVPAFLTEEGTIDGPRNIRGVGLIAFSVTFEMDFANILSMLEAWGIPLKSADRNERHPLVVMGGIVPTMNPEPLAEFADFFVLGEGEMTLGEWVGRLSAAGRSPRAERLSVIKDVAGVYVPSLYEIQYGPDGGIASRRALDGAPARVGRLYDPGFGTKGSAETEVFGESVFKDSRLIETGKGCGQGCRFCAAGFVYRPVRHVSLDLLERQADEGLAAKGRIALIGSAICEHPRIAELYRHILQKGGGLTVSSLRVEFLTGETLGLLAQGGLKTMTIAPEAGSFRLRGIVNKPITDDDVLNAVSMGAEAGILNVKCYFLIGLPGEEEGDVEALIALSKKIRDALLAGSKKRGRAGKITIGINPFVPKAQTPFQWEPVAPLDELKAKVLAVKRGLAREANIELRAESPKNAAAQGVLSMGGRGAADMLLRARAEKGWTALLRTDAAKRVYARRKGYAEVLPWDFIDGGVSREYLEKEHARALKGKTTPPCPPEKAGCRRCGDFSGNCY